MGTVCARSATEQAILDHKITVYCSRQPRWPSRSESAVNSATQGHTTHSPAARPAPFHPQNPSPDAAAGSVTQRRSRRIVDTFLPKSKPPLRRLPAQIQFLRARSSASAVQFCSAPGIINVIIPETHPDPPFWRRPPQSAVPMVPWSRAEDGNRPARHLQRMRQQQQQRRRSTSPEPQMPDGNPVSCRVRLLQAVEAVAVSETRPGEQPQCDAHNVISLENTADQHHGPSTASQLQSLPGQPVVRRFTARRISPGGRTGCDIAVDSTSHQQQAFEEVACS
jgi:hypothetical protein